MSEYSFTYNQEIGHQGQSLIPHYPGGSSGVTIGPGYDLSQRTPHEIFYDLSAAGIEYESIAKLLSAAQKSGSEAASWIAEHGGISITEEQQRALYDQVLVPMYEERAMDQLEHFKKSYGILEADLQWENLSTKQREALFDFVYNTGGLSKFPEFTLAVLHDDWESVSFHYERFSGEMPLLYRNEMFYQKFILNIQEDASETGNYLDSRDGTQEDETEHLNDLIDDLYSDPDDIQDDNRMDDWYEIH